MPTTRQSSHVCGNCGTPHERGDLQEAPNDNLYCSPCFDEVTMTCYDCDDLIMRSDSQYDDNSDEHYCSDCFPGQRVRFLASNNFTENPSKRFVGIELEFIKTRENPEVTRYGRFKSDGSVNNNGSKRGGEGMEYVTHPCNGDRLFNNIDKICRRFDEVKAYVNKTCGLHVHLDMRESTAKEQRSIYNAWYSLEKIFFGMMSKSRKINRYCQPLSVSSITDAMSGQDRYRSLNVTAYGKYKTFEVRLHQGSLNPTKIKNWVTFLLSFFDTFSKVEFTKEKKDEVLALSDREKLIFLFQQVKIPLELKKYIVKRLWKFSGKDCYFLFEKKGAKANEFQKIIDDMRAQQRDLKQKYHASDDIDEQTVIMKTVRDLERKIDEHQKKKVQSAQRSLTERLEARRARERRVRRAREDRLAATRVARGLKPSSRSQVVERIEHDGYYRCEIRGGHFYFSKAWIPFLYGKDSTTPAESTDYLVEVIQTQMDQATRQAIIDHVEVDTQEPYWYSLRSGYDVDFGYEHLEYLKAAQAAEGQTATNLDQVANIVVETSEPPTITMPSGSGLDLNSALTGMLRETYTDDVMMRAVNTPNSFSRLAGLSGWLPDSATSTNDISQAVEELSRLEQERRAQSQRDRQLHEASLAMNQPNQNQATYAGAPGWQFDAGVGGQMQYRVSYDNGEIRTEPVFPQRFGRPATEDELVNLPNGTFADGERYYNSNGEWHFNLLAARWEYAGVFEEGLPRENSPAGIPW